MVDTKVRGAARVLKMIQHPEKLLSTILLSNNLVNTAAAALGTALAISLWGEKNGIIIATAGVTVLLLIFGETTPKTIANQQTNTSLEQVVPHRTGSHQISQHQLVRRISASRAPVLR